MSTGADEAFTIDPATVREWKRYPEYKDSGVEWLGEVPVGWSKQKLGWVADLIVPQRDKPPIFGGNIPWIRIEDFKGKYISDSKSGQRVSPETIKNMNLKVHPAGTVLCSCSCNMGITAIVERPLISNQTFIGIFPRKNISSEFLYYLMGGISDQLQALGSGAIQQYLSRENFYNLKLAIPPLPEQHTIAAFLDRETARIDALIEKKRRFIELLEEKRQALISHAVTKGLDPDAEMKDSGVEWIGEVPVGWEIKKIHRIVKRVINKNDDGSERPMLSLSSTKGIVYKIYEDESLIRPHDECLTYQIVKPNQLVVNPMWIINSSIGVSKLTGIVSPAYRVYDINKSLLPEYLHLLVKSPLYISQYWRYIRGLKTYDRSVREIDFYQIECLIPLYDEQKMIVEYIQSNTSQYDSLVIKTNQQIEKLQEFRTALISAAVTGKIDVRGEEEAA